MNDEIKWEICYYYVGDLNTHKIDIPQDFKASKKYPNNYHERPIYCLEYVYKEVKWKAIKEYLKYKEGIDIPNDKELNDVYMRLGLIGHNTYTITKDVKPFIQEYFNQAIVKKC